MQNNSYNNFKNKYIKYKSKYLELKQIGAGYLIDYPQNQKFQESIVNDELNNINKYYAECKNDSEINNETIVNIESEINKNLNKLKNLINSEKEYNLVNFDNCLNLINDFKNIILLHSNIHCSLYKYISNDIAEITDWDFIINKFFQEDNVNEVGIIVWDHIIKYENDEEYNYNYNIDNGFYYDSNNKIDNDENEYYYNIKNGLITDFYNKIKIFCDNYKPILDELSIKYYQAIRTVLNLSGINSILYFYDLFETKKENNYIDKLISKINELINIKNGYPIIDKFTIINKLFLDINNKCTKVKNYYINLFNNILSNELTKEKMNEIVLLNDKLMNLLRLSDKLINKESNYNFANQKINDFKKILEIQDNINNIYDFINNNSNLEQDILENKWISIKNNILEIENIYKPYSKEVVKLYTNEKNKEILKKGNDIFQLILYKEEKQDQETKNKIDTLEKEIESLLNTITSLKSTVFNTSCNTFDNTLKTIKDKNTQILNLINNYKLINKEEEKKSWETKYNNILTNTNIDSKKKELRCK